MDDGRVHGREVPEGTLTEREGVTVDAPSMRGTLVPGAELGGRYRIVCRVGAGGMGEVWRAHDLKLRVEVALKALRGELFGDERRRDLLRQEVRAAREVVSPNVCRIYDLVEADGRELVSMEYVDGATLLSVLQERGPLELKEAQDIASQFLAGLEAIHKAGLVHRDVKPENIMLTRAGRVVVMDFGLARREEDPARSASGTPAYMAPEQARGEAVDARADVYSAGVVLAEMVCPEGIKSIQSRQSLWEGVRSEPPKLPDSPWAPVLRRAVAKAPEQRYHTAHTLTRALEEVTLRVAGAEDLTPYPGLASFTEADAEYFFGREAEVEAMWRRLEGPARLLGLAGPSGAGKSSFLRAGLVPRAGSGWAIVRCTPGDGAISSLRRALIPVLAGDTEALQQLVDAAADDALCAAVARWRGRHDHGLLIVDQFEELFTLNRRDEQTRFASVLGSLALRGDLHVLLAMRDDFLAPCNGHEALRPIFSELTLLDPPAGANLRRALTQPALACGYRFEDDALVEEMLGEVEGERGALPLLAFAAARLWEKRDREAGLLTRQAYRDIGGVGGALAQHAEATMDRIGAERIALVRELFRNLVTAEGTRAVREWHELLSVFDDAQRASAEEVLRALIDARLLTSYELRQEEGEPTRRVEIIHESLLASWPRLVRWRTQDADAAQLRDQLRQAARTWHEHGRIDDLLWAGSAFREYALWRERYPGGLTELEEAFAAAMTSLVNRRRRRRWLAVAAGFAVLLAVLVVVGVMWRRSVLQTRRAEAEAAQREAAQLLALGRLELASQPNASLAYAIASLERADNDPARRFALEVLAQGPPARFLSDPVNAWSAAWSPDGRRLAIGGNQGLVVFERGTEQRLQLSSSLERTKGFTSDGRRLVTQAVDGAPTTLHVWAFPEGRLERTLGDAEAQGAMLVGDHLLSFSNQADGSVLVRHLPLDGASPELIGRLDLQGVTAWSLEPTLTQLLTIRGGRLVQQRLDDLAAPGRVIGTHDSAYDVYAWTWRDRAVTWDRPDGGASELRLWDLPAARIERIVSSPVVPGPIDLDPGGSFLAAGAARLFLFDLAAPATAEPVSLLFEDTLAGVHFSPDGSWLASVHNGTVILWNMAGPRPIVLGRREEGYWGSVAFTPDGDLLAASSDGAIGRWSLSPADGSEPRVLWPRPGAGIEAFLELDSAGRIAVVTERFAGVVIVVPLDGTEASTYRLKRPPGAAMFAGWASLDPSGRFLAVCALAWGNPEANGVRILDLETGDERTLDTHPEAGSGCEESGSGNEGIAVPLWLPDGRLITDGDAGLRLWDLDSGGSRLLRGCRESHPSSLIHLHATPDSRTILRLKGVVRVGDTSSLSAFDLASGEEREISSHGNRLVQLALDPSGTILMTVDWDGVVRVGPLTGEEPHLLFGHNPGDVAVSPDGRWIAATVDDPAIRLWRMPDLSKPPLHTLPYDELLAKLKSLTNLRAVRDPGSDTGWKIEIGPFPGWAEVPTWDP